MVVVVATVIGAAAIGLLLRHLIGPVMSGVFRAIRFIGQVVLELIRDIIAALWHVVVVVLMMPVLIGLLLIGRWGAVGARIKGLGYRFKKVGRRVAGVVTRPAVGKEARAQVHRTTSTRAGDGSFPGWRVVGQLQAGGSGATLHIAEPTHEAPPGAPDRVVIKCFDVADGSPLGQMIRESRALGGAKELGLVIEHDHDESRFWYACPFIPGVHLAEAVEGLHASGGSLDTSEMASVLRWARDLLATLQKFHDAGFWHKDVKPENIITNDTGAHLVDLGLVTPLQSAMTLTTHGTEYFRDPELVRQALRGAKVSEVDGARFDIYSAGAVLYYMVEGTFPAHGNLSRFDGEHGDGIRWVIRRAMADYHQRYPTAAEMLADIACLMSSPDPRSVRPADLPTFTGARHEDVAPPSPSTRVSHTRPRLEVTDWWTGAYRVLDAVPGVPTRLPDAFTAARRARDARRMARAERRARRRAAVGGVMAFLVGLAVLTAGYFGVRSVATSWSGNPVEAQASELPSTLPQGHGQVLLVSDHPRQVDSRVRVAGALQDQGWDFTADSYLEAQFRSGLPVDGTASTDFPMLARRVLRTHNLAGAAVISAPADDPNGIEAIFITQDSLGTYRLPPLVMDAADVQSAP